jgi:hypothetical protein
MEVYLARESKISRVLELGADVERLSRPNSRLIAQIERLETERNEIAQKLSKVRTSRSAREPDYKQLPRNSETLSRNSWLSTMSSIASCGAGGAHSTGTSPSIRAAVRNPWFFAVAVDRFHRAERFVKDAVWSKPASVLQKPLTIRSTDCLPPARLASDWAWS